MRCLNRPLIALAWAVTLLSTAGCTGDGLATVKGKVTLDNVPLKEGVIRFVSTTGDVAPAEAPIKDGLFSAEVPLGDKRVEISAPKVVGKMKMIDEPGAPSVDRIEEMLPARFNTQSELKMTVKAGSQEKDFPVFSK